MVKYVGDIDIDVKDRNEILSKIKHISASIIKDNTIKKHNNGVYVVDVPVDPVTQLCSLDFGRAEELKYMKIDFLNVHIYNDVRDDEHLKQLIDQPVQWELLEYEEIVSQLFHLHDYFDLVEQMQPNCIEHIAMLIAIKMPGKRYLIGKSWEEIEKEIWIPTSSPYFKKSHCYAYSLAVVVQLNLMVENLNKSSNFVTENI